MEWLHYIGRRYTPESFIAEARQHGVARRVPAWALGTVKWGEKVWLAQWKGSKGVVTVAEGKEPEEKRFAKGRAEIFASFTVDRVSIEDPEVRAKLLEELSQEGKVTATSGAAPTMVRRKCGYYIRGVAPQ